MPKKFRIILHLPKSSRTFTTKVYTSDDFQKEIYSNIAKYHAGLTTSAKFFNDKSCIVVPRCELMKTIFEVEIIKEEE